MPLYKRKVLLQPQGPQGGADRRFFSPLTKTPVYTARPRIRG